MKTYPIEIGSVVRSLAGRDSGRLFVVTAFVDEDFVLVANGRLRTMEHLKKKRRKHLKPTGRRLEELADRLSAGEKVEDHEIRSWLKKEEEELVKV